MLNSTNNPSTISLNLEEDEALAEALRDKQHGDTCTVKVTFKIDEVSASHIKGAIDEVVPEGYKRSKMKSDEKTPIALVFNAKGKY